MEDAPRPRGVRNPRTERHSAGRSQSSPQSSSGIGGNVQRRLGDVQRKLGEFYSFELMPKTFLLKFRQRVDGYQLGANFEVNGCNPKLVFKPASANSMWKVVCEPKHGDMRLFTKKIPIGSLLQLQVGIGHDFHKHSTGWKWKVTSSLGSTGLPKIHQKTVLPIFPGFDVAVGWNAQYELPDLHGALGTGEPAVEMNVGRLHASIEQLAAIYTHVG